MIHLLQRDFSVTVPVQEAWNHLAEVTNWPTWAPHIRSIELTPEAPLGPESSGIIRLSNSIKSTFRMTVFDPHRHWKWRGSFLWLTVDYDHQFEDQGNATRLVWVVEAQGLGASIIGRLFAHIYNRNLDRAIPRLIDQINCTHSSGT